MNGQCCHPRWSLWKWPLLLALALLLSGTLTTPSSAGVDTPGGGVAKTEESGPVTLTAETDRSEARVADRIRLTLRATAPQGVRVQFPEAPGELGEFEVVRSEDAFDVPAGTDRLWTRTLWLESLASGTKEVPAVTLTYTDSRPRAAVPGGTVASPSLPITIVGNVEANADPTRFRDIKGVVELPTPPEGSPVWIMLAAGGAGLLALTGLAWMLVPRRQQTAEEWALSELSRLERSELMAAGEFDAVFCRITDLLREYLERRFDIRAPKLTTPEFIATAEHHASLSGAQRHLLQAFLRLADCVKFARLDVAEIDAARAIDHARQFIGQASATPANAKPPADITPHARTGPHHSQQATAV